MMDGLCQRSSRRKRNGYVDESWGWVGLREEGGFVKNEEEDG